MGWTVIKGGAKANGIIYKPDYVLFPGTDTLTDTEILALKIKLTRGANTTIGVNTIELDLSGQLFADTQELVDYLNNNVTAEYGLKGLFVITDNGFIAYDNADKYASIVLEILNNLAPVLWDGDNVLSYIIIGPNDEVLAYNEYQTT